MKLKDIPFSPAYLVFHDAFDRGAMEVWPVSSIEEAQKTATAKQEALDASGSDECGSWKAYVKLPRVRVWKYHAPKQPAKFELIDWAERYPNETALQIAVRQSTVCPCGKPKDIGQATCGHEVKA